MHTSEDFCICFKKNYKRIKLNLQLHRHNRHGVGNINLEIDDNNDSYIVINYADKHNENIEKNKNDNPSNLGKIGENKDDISSNLEKINTNKNNISSNLIKINSNENDVLYSLSEIDYLKNNISKSYLETFIIFYFMIRKLKSILEIYFMKVFDINSKQNDFIEMNFKISLRYEDISERSYVKSVYQIFDENNNSLYIKSVNNHDDQYYSNKTFIDENIFYNFTKNIKKIKFVVKFKMILTRVIKLWYIKNENYKFILKHY